MGSVDIEGVDAVVRNLRRIEPELAMRSVAKMKAPATGAAAAVRATAPRKVLPGVAKKSSGPVRTRVKFGGRKRADGSKNLLSVALVGPRWTVAADMAARNHGSNTFVTSLNARYGGASRFMWPTVEKFVPQIVAGLRAAVAETERTLSDAMRGRV